MSPPRREITIRTRPGRQERYRGHVMPVGNQRRTEYVPDVSRSTRIRSPTAIENVEAIVGASANALSSSLLAR